MASRRNAFIGVDLGTTLCKSVVVNADGRVLAEASVGYLVRRTAQGEASHDPHRYLAAMASTIRDCVRAAPTVRIGAIGVTAPAHYPVLVDERGNPLARTLLSSDRRPGPIAERLATELGPSFFDHTLVRLTAGWTLPQVAFLRSEDRQRWRRVRQVLMVKDFARGHLTGSWATDPSDAAGTALFDQRAQRWWSPALEAAGLDASQVPLVRPSISIAGTLVPSWARRTGLPAGTPVAIGATDTAAELVSLGAVDEGDGLVKIATTGTVVAVTARPRPDPRLLTYPHALPGRWYTAAATNTAAAAVRWLREDILADPSASLERATRKAAAGSDGVLFLPFLEGERAPYWDATLRAAFVGLASFHTPDHLVRAALEGVAFSLRACREVLGEIGLAVRSPVFTGGGGRSPLWRSILAATLATPGRTAEPQGPAIGAAILAAAAVGEWPGRTVGGHPRFALVRPDPKLVRIYEERYRAYVRAVAAVRGLAADQLN
jgi:xylulokinase